ncbi:hypothetical protein SP19_68 [Salmonella phage 19]|nr:hypothetical protein SP19_68 [Salmonella phage 19]
MFHGPYTCGDNMQVDQPQTVKRRKYRMPSLSIDVDKSPMSNLN